MIPEGSSAAPALLLLLLGCTPGLLRPLPPQEQRWRVLEGRWERNSRANSELAEQTAASVKQSGPVLLKLSKYCVRHAAGSGACPSHQVEHYQRADTEQPGEAGRSCARESSGQHDSTLISSGTPTRSPLKLKGRSSSPLFLPFVVNNLFYHTHISVPAEPAAERAALCTVILSQLWLCPSLLPHGPTELPQTDGLVCDVI